MPKVLRRKATLQARINLKPKTPLAKKPLRKRKSKRKDIKAANLARSIWRTIGYCENCKRGTSEVQLQGAHIIGTGASPRLCSDLRNGLCLCSHCHRVFTSDPLSFYEFLDGYLPKGRLKMLRLLQKSTEKVDWDERLEFLNDIKHQIEAGELTIAQAREYEPVYRS